MARSRSRCRHSSRLCDLHCVRADVLPDWRREFLFVPLAEAVVFAMLASYLLSRTLVPTLVMYLLRRAMSMKTHSRQEPRGLLAPLQRFQTAV